jgi:hypothetical protein
MSSNTVHKTKLIIAMIDAARARDGESANFMARRRGWRVVKVRCLVARAVAVLESASPEVSRSHLKDRSGRTA